MHIRSGAIQTKYIVIGVVALVLIWILMSYNGLVAEKETVNNSWRQVETQYQRRFDLVPNLVSTVKGAANFEQSTLTQITDARSQWQGAGSNRAAQVGAAQTLDTALSRLIVTVEAYPQLKATQAFSDLMTQLEGTENRISTARKDYNDTVRVYNIRVKSFPGNVLAGLFGFAAEEGFEASAGASSAPTVDFGNSSSI